MLFSDILPGILSALAQRTAPVGGPVVPALPKAASNATAMYLPPVKVPYTDPAAMLNAIANASGMPSEIALRQAQANLYGMQGAQTAALVDLYRSAMEPPPPEFGGAAGSPAGTGGASGSSPSAPPLGTPAQSAPAAASPPKEPKASLLNTNGSDWWKPIVGTANFAKNSGIFGDPTQPGWEENNIVTVKSPSGATFRVNKLAAPSFAGFLADLDAEGYKVASGGSYNIRNIRGGDTLSEHAFGNAIDINPAANPMQPNLKTDLPANVSELAAKWGLTWGGDWKSRKDPMHFEWAGVNPLTGVDYRANVAEPPRPVQVAQATPQTMTDVPASAFAALVPGVSNLVPGGAGLPPISPEYLAWARRQDQINALLGRRNPVSIENVLQMAPGGALSPQYLAAAAAAKGWGGLGPELAKAWNTPQVARPGSGIFVGGRMIGAMPTLETVTDSATGQKVYRYISPMTGAPAFAMTRDPQTGQYSVAHGGGNTVAALGPGQEEALKGQAAALNKEYGEVVSGYQTAYKSLPALLSLQSSLASFRTGPSAATRLSVQRAWQDFAQAVGLPADSDLAKTIASGEIINKSGTWLGFNLARTLGSREAQMIVEQSIRANPNLLGSPEGNEKLVGLIREGLQRDMDRRAFYDNWFTAHHNFAGAATAFDQAAPVEMYETRILPAQPSSKAAYDALRPGTTYIAPDGSTRIKPPDPQYAQFLPRAQ